MKQTLLLFVAILSGSCLESQKEEISATDLCRALDVCAVMIKVPEKIEPHSQMRLEVIGKSGVLGQTQAFQCVPGEVVKLFYHRNSQTFSILTQTEEVRRFTLDMGDAADLGFVSDRFVYAPGQIIASNAAVFSSPQENERALRLQLKGPISGEKARHRVDWNNKE